MKRVRRAAEFFAWALFFAVAGLVLALRFWVLPDIERYRGFIAEKASAAVGQPVKIGGIAASWRGLHPHLRLTDVRLYDREGREALVLPEVDNVFSWRALLLGDVKLRSLAVNGLRLQVRRDAAGELYVAGAPVGGEGRFASWLLRQEEIVVRDAAMVWHDELREAPPLALSQVQIRMKREGARHALGIAARPPAALGAALEVRGLLEADSLARPDEWSGRLYAELGATDLSAWGRWIDLPLQIGAGEGALRTWITLEQGRLTHGSIELAIAGVEARLARELAPLRLSSFAGRLSLRRLEEGFALVGRRVAVASLAPIDFDLRWDGVQGSVSSTELELEPVAKLAAAFPLPAEVRSALSALEPRGRLGQTRYEWSGAPGAPKAYSLRTQFTDLGARAAGTMPGFAGLNGTLEATDAGGRVKLAARKSELSFPRIFPQPRIALDLLDGEIAWVRTPGAVVVRTSSVSFANAHLSGNLHGEYAWQGSGPGTLDLSAQLNRADAAQVARYLPHGHFIGSGVRDWVARAIVAGRSSDVRVRLQGDLAHFPFVDTARGQFSVAARLENVTLDYLEGWPRIGAIHGELLFQREGMELIGRSARVHGVALSDVRVAIPRLAAEHPQLRITGRAAGATADFLGFIAASPVRDMTGGITEGMRAAGEGRLALNLQIPLAAPKKTRVSGEYAFANNTLTVHPELPALAHAGGTLAFTEASLAVQDVRAALFGGTVALSGGRRADGAMEILARGDARAEALQGLVAHPSMRALSGSAPYLASVLLGERGTRVRIDSSLEGIESALPAPLGKRAGEVRPLRVERIPEKDGDRIVFSLARTAAGELQRRRAGEAMRIERAALALGAAERPRLPQSGTAVLVRLPALDLDHWRAHAGSAGMGQDIHFDARVGALSVLGKRLHDVWARGRSHAEGWSASVQARELAGELGYSAQGAGWVTARLAHFSVPDGEAPGAGPRAEADPKNLPSMDFLAERFRYRGKDLGRVELVAHHAGDDWRIERLRLRTDDAELSGSGWWRSGVPSRTSLDFRLQASDAGSFLARVGYPALVKGGRAELKGSLAWNGEPLAIDYASLAGGLELNAQEGQFLEIEPGFGKLISLMSLQSLPRRITLDFRDVFSKGFEFERIASSGQVQGGIMALKDFRMRGSAARVEMSGELDLAREGQDLRVRVVPSLGDSAATVIALVNPLLAIPAAIAQKILKDPLGHIFAFDYGVTGSWSDPKVEKLGVHAQELGSVPSQ